MNVPIPVVIASEAVKHVDPRSLAQYRLAALNTIDSNMFSLSTFSVYNNRKFGLVIRFKLDPLESDLKDADSFLMIWRDQVTHNLVAAISVLPKPE